MNGDIEPKFSGDPWWDNAQQAMRFELELNGISYKCAISQNVLNDHFKTSDTKKSAIENFHNHCDVVRSMAWLLIQNGMSNASGVFFITLERCRELKIDV